MVAIQIKVVSDTLCPWCYVGKRNLDRAMDLYRQSNPNTTFQVLYKPFYLYPNLVRTGTLPSLLFALQLSGLSDRQSGFEKEPKLLDEEEG